MADLLSAWAGARSIRSSVTLKSPNIRSRGGGCSSLSDSEIIFQKTG